MRWDCGRYGCFNLKKRPKLEAFADCFRYGINFGDVDMVVERNGRFLFCEWKSLGAITSVGQSRLRDALLRSPAVTFIEIFGDAEAMSVVRFVVHRGRERLAIDDDLLALKKHIADWFDAADSAGGAT